MYARLDIIIDKD